MRVWKLLCRKPYLAPREVAAEFGWTCVNTSKLLQTLFNRGCVSARGESWRRRYYATEVEPTDRNGMHPNSAIGRKLGATRKSIDHANAVKLAMIEAGTLKYRKRKHIVAPARESVYVGKIALEQFWTFPTKHCQESQDVV